MAFSAVNGASRPALATRLTLSLGLVALCVGLIFTAIYFVLSISLFSRLASQELEQKAQSARTIIDAVSNAKDEINSSTYIRHLRQAKVAEPIGVFSKKNVLMAHTDEQVSTSLSKLATDPKLKLRLVEEQHKLLRSVIGYHPSKSTSAFYRVDDIRYMAVVHGDYVILAGLTVQQPKFLTLAVSFFLLCLLAVGINALFIYHYGHSLAHSLIQISRGLDVDSIRVDSIQPQYQEVEALLHGVDEKIRQARSLPSAAPVATIASQDNILQQMQNKLFERPFPRMAHHELAVYPRRPKLSTREFISGVQDSNHIDVLIGVTDSDSADALVVKHRLQERFWALAAEQLASDAMARNLWTAFFNYSEFVPGIFFARFDENTSAMDIYRAGGVHLFEVFTDGRSNPIHVGSENFGSEYTMVSEHHINSGSHLVMVSHDAFSAMELSEDDFAELLGRLGKAKTGKILLAGILEKIHQKLEAGETVPGLLAVLSEKHK